MHLHSICEQHGSTPIISFTWWMDVHHFMLNASVPFPAIVVPIAPMDESKLWNPPNRMTTPEGWLHGSSARTISLVFALNGWSKCDIDASPSTFIMLLRCIHNSYVHCYRLFASMFTNGIGRATYIMLYADVLLCILLIYPLHHGRGRIICKHNKKVYNTPFFQV